MAATSGVTTGRSITIPPQSTPAVAGDGTVNKTWWLALSAQTALVNTLAAAPAGDDSSVTLKGLPVTY